jgi:hypothetical protein
VATTQAELTCHLPAWADLAADAVEPNVFYEPWLLLPALRAFGGGRDLRFVLLFAPDRERPGGAPRLCGFFPLERRRGYLGLPVAVLRLWRHLHCFLTTPLLRRGDALPCLGAFFDWLAADPRGRALFDMEWLKNEGPFQQALIEVLHRRAALSYVAESYTRAVFRPRVDAENFLNLALTGKSRKKLRRQGRQLEELGRVECVALEQAGEVDAWIEDFLRLEASGWKGREGTAMLCSPPEPDFFRGVARGLYFPVNAPHWVQNSDAVSISFSITFQTPALERRSVVYQVNNFLRGWGLRPRPFGQSPWRDSLKFTACRVVRRVKRLWPGRNSG